MVWGRGDRTPVRWSAGAVVAEGAPIGRGPHDGGRRQLVVALQHLPHRRRHSARGWHDVGEQEGWQRRRIGVHPRHLLRRRAHVDGVIKTKDINGVGPRGDGAAVPGGLQVLRKEVVLRVGVAMWGCEGAREGRWGRRGRGLWGRRGVEAGGRRGRCAEVPDDLDHGEICGVVLCAAEHERRAVGGADSVPGGSLQDL